MKGRPRSHPVSALMAAVCLLVAGCVHPSPEAPETETYREPTGRFTLDHPAGWHLTEAEAAGVAHWRFTPTALPDPTADSPREISVAYIRLPEDLDLTAASLEEVAEYVRDATIETTGEVGQRYRAGPPSSGTIGGRRFSRFDLAGTDADGVEHRLAILVVRQESAAVVLSFGCPVAVAGEVMPLLERCAKSLRLPPR